MPAQNSIEQCGKQGAMRLRLRRVLHLVKHRRGSLERSSEAWIDICEAHMNVMKAHRASLRIMPDAMRRCSVPRSISNSPIRRLRSGSGSPMLCGARPINAVLRDLVSTHQIHLARCVWEATANARTLCGETLTEQHFVLRRRLGDALLDSGAGLGQKLLARRADIRRPICTGTSRRC